MTTGRRTTLYVFALAAGMVLLVLAAAAGPAAMLSPSGRTRDLVPPPPPTPTGEPEASGNMRARDGDEDLLTLDLGWLGEIALWTLVLVVLLAVAGGLRYAWQNRWRPPEKPVDEELDVLPPGAAAEAIRADAALQLAAVREGSPRNGIVRCWLRLEEVVAEAGLPRNAWETSAEFTVRVLHVLDLDPRAIGELARLYREARFSAHELGEPARTAAEAALQQLHNDLDQLAVGAGNGRVSR